MKSVHEFKGVFIHREPVDMRKSYSLAEIVQLENMGDLMGPYLFVFTGKRRDSIKLVYFDKNGFALWQKRLERDKFPWPRKFLDKVLTLTSEQFEWLLSGYDVWKMKPFKELNFEKVI